MERGNSLLAFRMDDRKQRIVIDRAMGDGTRFFGWEVADSTALDALAARLENAGVPVTSEPQTLADARRVRGSAGQVAAAARAPVRTVVPGRAIFDAFAR